MKYFLLCLCSCINLVLFAQKETTFKHISTGIKVGSDIGLLSLETNPNDSRTGLDFGYSVIVDFVEFRLNEKFGLNLGVGYTKRKYRQTIENIYITDVKGNALVKEHLLVQNIEVPLTFRYYLSNEKSSYQVYFSAGGSLYFNLHNQSKQEIFLPMSKK